MIDAREQWTMKKQWPTDRGRFIGTAGIREDNTIETYQRKCRYNLMSWKFYIDRIVQVKYLKSCYEEGYSKDIDFSTQVPLTRIQKLSFKLQHKDNDGCSY